MSPVGQLGGGGGGGGGGGRRNNQPVCVPIYALSPTLNSRDSPPLTHPSTARLNRGTPLYAAPSAAKSELPDPLDDVFSFGIVMLEVATELTGVEFIRTVYPPEVATAEDIVRFHAEGKRPEVPEIVKQRCGAIYVSIMKKCWSHDILERPVSVKVARGLAMAIAE